MAPTDPLPSAIERLIDQLGSVGAPELLLQLRDAAPSRISLADVCAGLRCPVSWAELQLGRLRHADLVAGIQPKGSCTPPAHRNWRLRRTSSRPCGRATDA